MNPFDLRGPEFLAFYTLFGAATLAIVRLLLNRFETDSTTRPIPDDYLEIAYLRGGRNEALRVATMNLVNRGLLEVTADDKLHAPEGAAVTRAAKRSERAILERFREPRAAASLFRDAGLSAAVRADCEPSLERLGLLPDAARRATRRALMAGAVLVLAGIAGIKIQVALSRGRTNILFLIIETVVFCALAYKVTHPFRTPAGTALLGDLDTLFAGLKARAGSLSLGAAPQDFALLVAVFGMSALPPAFSFDRLFQKAGRTTQDGGGCGAFTGSSCGSSSDSGGGGCGGGSGCGGGGGGCGGCGS